LPDAANHVGFGTASATIAGADSNQIGTGTARQTHSRSDSFSELQFCHGISHRIQRSLCDCWMRLYFLELIKMNGKFLRRLLCLLPFVVAVPAFASDCHPAFPSSMGKP